MSGRRAALSILFIVAVGAIPVGLVLYVIASSFDVSNAGKPFQFGLEGWRLVLTGTRNWNSIVNSFILAIRVPIALVVAFVIAWLLIRLRVPGGRFIEICLWFGFALPAVPMTLGWILLLDSHYGLLNTVAMKLPFVTGPIFSIYSIPGIIWVHLSLTTIPIMVILLTPALRQLDAALEESAGMSGAGAFSIVRAITIPLILPTILTAVISGTIRSLDAFEVERLLGTPSNINVYSTRIYDLVNADPPAFPQAMALSTVFLVILLAMAMAYQIYQTRASVRSTIGGKGIRFRAPMRSVLGYAISCVLVLYILVTIALPLVVLLFASFTKIFGFFFIANAWTPVHWQDVLSDVRFGRAVVTSIVLGVSVGTMGVVIFSLIAWVLVRSNLWGRAIVGFLIWLPWGIPGMVLGITLLSAMLNTPLLSSFYGTIVPLVLALVIKEMPIGVQLLRNAVAQVSSELEEAAAMSGARLSLILRRITLPLIAPMVVSVFLFIFTATIRDISTVILIAPPGVRSLSLLMFEFGISGKLESASVIGVIIAVLCLAMTAIAFRLGSRFGISGQR